MPDNTETKSPEEKPQPEKSDRFEEEPLVPIQAFLEEFPVNTAQKVSDYYHDTEERYNRYRKNTPQLRLYCANEACKGYRRFDGQWGSSSAIGGKDFARDFLVYRCRDCGVQEKTFCILSTPYDEKGNGIVVKVGEFPELHIDLPPALPKLLGEDYPVFIKGLTA